MDFKSPKWIDWFNGQPILGRGSCWKDCGYNDSAQTPQRIERKRIGRIDYKKRRKEQRVNFKYNNAEQTRGKGPLLWKPKLLAQTTNFARHFALSVCSFRAFSQRWRFWCHQPHFWPRFRFRFDLRWALVDDSYWFTPSFLHVSDAALDIETSNVTSCANTLAQKSS